MSQTQEIIRKLEDERELARKTNMPIFALGISRAIEVLKSFEQKRDR